jgi:hypothetical protein
MSIGKNICLNHDTLTNDSLDGKQATVNLRLDTFNDGSPLTWLRQHKITS